MSSESKQANKHTQNTILMDLQLVNRVSHKLEQIFTFIIRLHSGAPTALSIFLCIYDCRSVDMKLFYNGLPSPG